MANYISKLNTIFQYAYHSERSSFYRVLCGTTVPKDTIINSLVDFRTLPFVTKADLQAVPLMERMFGDTSKANVLRNSSGTSGKVLITLRSFVWRFDDLFEHYTPTGVLHFSEVSYGDENVYRACFPDIAFVAGELDGLELGVKLAVGLPINTISCWLYGYEKLISVLDKYCISREKIEMVVTFGERMTPIEYQKLCKAFPNAHIYTIFGATELQDCRLGHSLDAFDMELGSVFKTSKNLFLELIDLETGEIIEEVGREGETVVTMLWTEDNLSPLIRYRLGDLAMYHTYSEDPWERTIVTRGRALLEKISLPGGILQVIEFERVVNLYSYDIEADFELHFTLSHAETKKTQFELWVKPKREFDSEKLIQNIMEHLRLSPTRTFRQSVEEGLIPPMTIKLVNELSRENKKRLRFIGNKV